MAFARLAGRFFSSQVSKCSFLTSKPLPYSTKISFSNYKPSIIKTMKMQSRSYVTSSVFAPLDTFVRRHVGSGNDKDLEVMLSTLNLKNLDELVSKVVPSDIALGRLLNLPSLHGEASSPASSSSSQFARGEHELLAELKQTMSNNKINRNFIGMGYYGTITPPVILRNVLENPAWYTPYTPYQSEVSQGRLESLLNFQTMVTDLTGMDIAGASLLDEATAAAEAMLMAHRANGKNTFFVSDLTHPQTIATVKTRAEPLGINVIVGDVFKALLQPSGSSSINLEDVSGVLVSYPSTDGSILDYKKVAEFAHSKSALIIAASDLLALTVLEPPSTFGADIVIGSAQRFGVPMGYGGPHAAFLATKDEFKRSMPGRIIGVSKDSRGKTAYRMALGTREQHIRREKATSNICTAQALLANMAAMYAIYHGPNGLRAIANNIHSKALTLLNGLAAIGYKQSSPVPFFDTISITTSSKGVSANQIMQAAHALGLNLRKLNDSTITISIDEVTEKQDLEKIILAFATAGKILPSEVSKVIAQLDSFADASNDPNTLISNHPTLGRKSQILTHEVFNSFHSEHEMLRYLYRLQLKDIGLTFSMIPLGSCTMKLNATSEMIPVTWPEIGGLHPFAPVEQARGMKQMFNELEASLAEITGFHAVSLQPNAGSQGEYSGLLAIRAYHKSRGDHQRDICLIPVSAHGTNPASAVMAGMKVQAVKCDEMGNVDVSDLKAKAEEFKNELAALMITYPSTHGVFEKTIKEITSIIHANGGQVYLDGANMNAQVALCRPGDVGADVCHLNLHKTFCIPHGGGGPGMGPIGVAAHLAPFLPGHSEINNGTDPKTSIGAVSAAPWGSATILAIPYVYIKLMGAAGLRKATSVAILNANYMSKRLANYYKTLYTGPGGYVAHEFILDLRPFKQHGIEAEDVAKRLMDYSFHAPTLSFPVAGTLMIEPTESESRAELDRFCDALIQIRSEIQDIIDGKQPKEGNVLKNSPHTQDMLLTQDWNHPYSRETAAYPLPYLRVAKFWPAVGRVDNTYGDRNLVCSCPPMEDY